MEGYYCACITSLLKMPLQNKNRIDTKNLLKPDLIDKPYAIVTKEKSGEFSCVLMLKGSFLQIQMAAEFNNFQGLPFTAASTAIVSMLREGLLE